MRTVLTILFAAFVLLALDALYFWAFSWLFLSQIMQVQKTPVKMNILYALLCYVVLIGGLYYFILRERRSVWDAALLGLLIYGVFELTSGAMFSAWKPTTAILDTVWGGVLFAATTQIVYSALKTVGY